MLGKQVRRWGVYHVLRKRGFSKTSAAKIANSNAKKGRRGKRGKR